jgi:hypothetical protein
MLNEETQRKNKRKKDFSELSFGDKVEVLKLAVKYYFVGDPWPFAMEYAIALVKGWKVKK